MTESRSRPSSSRAEKKSYDTRMRFLIRYTLFLTLDSHKLAAHLVPLWIARLYQFAVGTISVETSTDHEAASAVVTDGKEHTGIGIDVERDGVLSAEANESSTAPSCSDPTTEAEALQRCCVLSRFLALLLVSPYMDMGAKGSIAFRSSLREVIPCFTCMWYLVTTIFLSSEHLLLMGLHPSKTSPMVLPSCSVTNWCRL